MTANALAGRAASPWLHGRAVDLLLGAGVAYLITLPPLFYFSTRSGTLEWPVSLAAVFALIFSLPHYGATLLRVYEQREDRKKYAVFAVYFTVVMVLAFLAGLWIQLLGSLLLTVYVTWSPWHFAGQNYGIALMFLRRRGVEIRPETKRWFYASFLLSFALAFLALHFENSSASYAQATTDASETFTTLRLNLPLTIVRPLVALFGLAYLVSLAKAAAGLVGGGAKPADLGAPAALVATQALWFAIPAVGTATGAYAIGSLPFAAIWISSAHAAQYLWVTSYYAGRTEAPTRPLPFLGRAMLAGAALAIPPTVVFAPGLLGSAVPYAAGVAVLSFSVINLHHFVLDGAIWKLRDGRVAQVLLRSGDHGTAAVPIGEPRLPWLRPALLGLGLASLVLIVGVIWAQVTASSRTAGLARVEAATRTLAWLGRDRGDLWANLGVRYEAAGDVDGAMQAFRESMRLGPQQPEIANRLTWIYLRHHRANPARMREAVQLARFTLSALGPRNVPALQTLAESHAAAGEADAALRVARRALAVARAQGDEARAAVIEQQIDEFRAAR